LTIEDDDSRWPLDHLGIDLKTVPVLRLIWRKEIRSAEEHAAWTAIGQETSESFR
jgi:hypothetical protein